MSLFQCQNCGCKENTALACQGCDGYAEGFFDWTGIEHRRGKKLCSACAPTKYSDGKPTEFGVWHGKFERVFLPMGEYRTGRDGNLERWRVLVPRWLIERAMESCKVNNDHEAWQDLIALLDPSAFPNRAAAVLATNHQESGK